MTEPTREAAGAPLSGRLLTEEHRKTALIAYGFIHTAGALPRAFSSWQGTAEIVFRVHGDNFSPKLLSNTVQGALAARRIECGIPTGMRVSPCLLATYFPSGTPEDLLDYVISVAPGRVGYVGRGRRRVPEVPARGGKRPRDDDDDDERHDAKRARHGGGGGGGGSQ